MTIFVAFNEVGECVSLGDNLVDGIELPENFTGLFSKRYKLIDNQIVDQFPELSDADAEKAWLATLPPPQPVEENQDNVEEN